MPLIKTLAEIKAVLPKLVSSISNTTLLPNFERAEYKYIVPIIGPTLYNTLVDHYNADTLDADETLLVSKLRLIIAAYAYKDELGLYVLTMGDTGAKKISQGGTTPVYGWEVQRLENTLVTSALDGIDVVLNYLFDNASIFPEWTDSDQYKKIAALLIRSGTDFTNQYTLFQPQRSFFTMRSVMYDAQMLFLESAIGTDLLIYLRDKADPVAKEKEAIDLLKKSLAFLTVFQACKHFSVSFTPAGFSIHDEGNPINNEYSIDEEKDITLLRMKMEECERQGQDYLELAKSKLVALYKGDAVDAFKTAYDAGPLKDYADPAEITSGNETRKSFVFR